jgi:hypothetical protein
MTYGYFGAVDESYSSTFPETDGVQKEHQRHKNTVFYLDKTTVRKRLRKFFLQMDTNIMHIKMFEITKCSEVTE